MKIRLSVTVAMLVLSMSMLVGCNFESRNPPTSQTLVVPMDQVLKQNNITQTVTLGVGYTLKLQLGANYTTPYRWMPDTKIADTSIVEQNSHQYVQPSTDALGAPGTEVWMFTALKPGTTTISTNYSSIVGKNTTPICQYTVIVTVQ
ncbi:protease inhibitor I42 family protein [Mycobacterium sp. Aquia_216]|uniref:protease inhibitor I42 family protein n=1 Tax=Mycobacterium sp. Aquia_216 TaxID=2991729 RepID=UPI00227C0B1A|nr:protease inhibitor I42 family protein [Mycobacterium sp. Aquia_216]WAJ47775.1 protease inhibitor I42 family protein [Mycobacterium sp. Aquia_216]